jgi:hypothetical protein
MTGRPNRCKAFLLISGLIICSKAVGQAWVPEAGQASVSAYYERGDVSYHLFSGDVVLGGVNYGKKLNDGHIRAQSMHLSIDYGVSNRLAISAGIPATFSRYEGTDPENLATDDGQFRGGLQDFRFEARYMAVEVPLVVTPFLSVVIPSHDYPTFGHVALGRRLKELHAGFYLGKLLTFISDDLVAEAGYEFAYTEKVGDTRPNRSHFDFGLGYFITPTITVNAYAAYIFTHAGMDWLDEMDETSFNDHDRMAKAKFLQLGGTLSYDVSDALRFFVGYSAIVSGENTHQIQSIAIGSTWSLQVLE